ncbi:hypothetical protein OPQ81_009766 [Rhizoctonia solani]|nr:hypothetical protein OPQ81_009766 [Rhizoctonia solani]
MKELELELYDISLSLKTLSTLNGGEPPLEIGTESEAKLAPWRESVLKKLHKLKDLLEGCDIDLGPAERARVISLTAVFVGQDNFTDEGCRDIAKDCLNNAGVLDGTTAACVLNDHVKPLFQVSVHPGVHLNTGRIKHNAISTQNMYDEQPWKINGAGCWNVLTWVLSNMNGNDLETLWPLVIPPLLTLLDDYKPLYKLRGVNVTQALLEKAPVLLLRRTGVDELLFKSLRGALQNLTSDSGPELLRATMPCYLALVDLVLPNDDLNRYTKLAELLTDVIIPGWLYASSRVDVMIGSVFALSLVVQVLGAGSIRFLKAIIPQLTENLSPKEFSPIHTTRNLQIASAKCLLLVMINARPRIPYWRVRILDSLLRCWVEVGENRSTYAGPEHEELRELLVSIFRELLASSQNLIENEISTLSTLDTQLFSALVTEAQGSRLGATNGGVHHVVIYELFFRVKKAWRQHYPADPPTWTQSDMPDLTGKVILVTGGSSGIGFEMCKAFLSKNANVYMAGRRSDKTQTVLTSLATIKKGELKFIEMDLASLDSTRSAAQEFLSQEQKLDILVNNAAEFLPPIGRLTNEGWIDHIDYDSVVEGEKRRAMDQFVNYGQSKLGLMLFSNELHRRYHRLGLVSVSLHPGTIKTNCFKHKPAWLRSILHLFMYPPEMGAITPLWAATTGDDLGGRYLLPWARVAQCESWAQDVNQMKKLWNWIIDQTEGFNPNIAQFREEQG